MNTDGAQKLVDAFLEFFPDAEWSEIAHHILSDGNCDDLFIAAAIERFENKTEHTTSDEATLLFLKILLLIPEHKRLTYNEE